jgi:hypothetical protein
MKARWLVWASAVVAAAFVTQAMAEEGGQAEKPKKDKPPAAKSFKGIVSAKAADAAADVVAVLTTKKGDVEKKLNLLTADATLKTKIEELAAKSAKVTVKGELTADGNGINATDISETVAKPPKAGGEKKGGTAAPQPGA